MLKERTDIWVSEAPNNARYLTNIDITYIVPFSATNLQLEVVEGLKNYGDFVSKEEPQNGCKYITYHFYLLKKGWLHVPALKAIQNGVAIYMESQYFPDYFIRVSDAAQDSEITLGQPNYASYAFYSAKRLSRNILSRNRFNLYSNDVSTQENILGYVQAGKTYGMNQATYKYYSLVYAIEWFARLADVNFVLLMEVIRRYSTPKDKLSEQEKILYISQRLPDLVYQKDKYIINDIFCYTSAICNFCKLIQLNHFDSWSKLINESVFRSDHDNSKVDIKKIAAYINQHVPPTEYIDNPIDVKPFTIWEAMQRDFLSGGPKSFSNNQGSNNSRTNNTSSSTNTNNSESSKSNNNSNNNNDDSTARPSSSTSGDKESKINWKQRVLVVSALLVFAFFGRWLFLSYQEYSAYKDAISFSNIAQVNSFLRDYPDSQYKNEVMQYRHSLSDDYYETYFANANSISDIEKKNVEFYLSHFTGENHYSEVRSILNEIEEKEDYLVAKQARSISSWKNFLNKYPDSKYKKEAQNVLTTLEKEARDAADKAAYQQALDANTIDSFEDYLSQYPSGKYRSQAQAKVNQKKEIERYKTNSLANGSQPWASTYGSNYGYSNDRNEIVINAGAGTDAVVLAKDVRTGYVEGHVYVRKNRTASFYLPSGRYEITFYYGNGWYPKLKIHYASEILKGGFLLDDYMDADKELVYFPSDKRGTMTYTLKPIVNGNVRTESKSFKKEF